MLSSNQECSVQRREALLSGRVSYFVTTDAPVATAEVAAARILASSAARLLPLRALETEVVLMGAEAFRRFRLGGVDVRGLVEAVRTGTRSPRCGAAVEARALPRGGKVREEALLPGARGTRPGMCEALGCVWTA